MSGLVPDITSSIKKEFLYNRRLESPRFVSKCVSGPQPWHQNPHIWVSGGNSWHHTPFSHKFLPAQQTQFLVMQEL